MKFNRMLPISIFVFLTSAMVLALPVFGDTRTPIDQVPMYGGMDRNAIAELKSGDEKLISSAVAEFGSREKASSAWVNRGFTLYQQDDLAGAMRRFNQAWLLNPDNPEVYWGFSAVLNDQQKFCEALKMVEMAETKGLLQPGFLPDAGLIYTGCTIQDKSLDSAVKEKYLIRSDELFSQALSSPAVKKEYTLFHWARAMYGRGDYVGAWQKVAQFRKETGKDFDARFIKSLSQKMAEPQ